MTIKERTVLLAMLLLHARQLVNESREVAATMLVDHETYAELTSISLSLMKLANAVHVAEGGE
jgi:hypothetical protein